VAVFFTAFLAGAALGLPNETLGQEKQRLQEVYLRPLPTVPYIIIVCLGRALELVLTLSTLTLLITVAWGADVGVVLRMLIVAAPIFAPMLGLGLLYLRGGPLARWPMISMALVYTLIGVVAFNICERTMFARGLINVE
jgi:hypothetical protein